MMSSMRSSQCEKAMSTTEKANTLSTYSQLKRRNLAIMDKIDNKYNLTEERICELRTELLTRMSVRSLRMVMNISEDKPIKESNHLNDLELRKAVHASFSKRPRGRIPSTRNGYDSHRSTSVDISSVQSLSTLRFPFVSLQIGRFQVLAPEALDPILENTTNVMQLCYKSRMIIYEFTCTFQDNMYHSVYSIPFDLIKEIYIQGSDIYIRLESCAMQEACYQAGMLVDIDVSQGERSTATLHLLTLRTDAYKVRDALLTLDLRRFCDVFVNYQVFFKEPKLPSLPQNIDINIDNSESKIAITQDIGFGVEDILATSSVPPFHQLLSVDLTRTSTTSSNPISKMLRPPLRSIVPAGIYQSLPTFYVQPECSSEPQCYDVISSVGMPPSIHSPSLHYMSSTYHLSDVSETSSLYPTMFSADSLSSYGDSVPITISDSSVPISGLTTSDLNAHGTHYTFSSPLTPGDSFYVQGDDGASRSPNFQLSQFVQSFDVNQSEVDPEIMKNEIILIEQTEESAQLLDFNNNAMRSDNTIAKKSSHDILNDRISSAFLFANP